MRETFGTMPMTKPEGMLRQIVFPELALMDVFTSDGRRLESSGRGVRDLPRTIYGQFENAEGHSKAVIIGALHEVTFEDGVASGRGWVLDDENGRDAVKYVSTQTLRHNSVDLADVKANLEFSDDGDMMVRFTDWNIAATTLVGKPAFGNAHAEIPDEVTASWMSDDAPLVVDAPLVMSLAVAEDEIMADGAPLPPWELFHQPEAAKPQKLTVGEPTEDGWIPVSGHLALWDSCHDGVVGRCTRVPRPDDNYASYNKPGVLTDRGMVGTGPIFLTGGHRQAKDGNYYDAYGGIENTWADVRVSAGSLGPWLSGYVRPGVANEQLSAARASRISGHWKGSKLKAIVSVNAEGFDVPGDGFSLDSDGHIDELVASFPVCFEDVDDPVDLTPWTTGTTGTGTRAEVWGPFVMTRAEDLVKMITNQPVEAAETEAEHDIEAEVLELALLDLELEDDE
jgi:hypothetical protein